MTKTYNRCTLALFWLATAGMVQAQSSISVSARPMQELLVDSERRAPAKVVSANRAAITSEVSAIVSAVHRDVGANVAKGELLIELDAANARNALAQAEANLSAIDAQIVEAKSRLAKAEDLLEKNFISDEELISRRASLTVFEANRVGAAAAIAQAKLELGRTRITAPFEAAVVERQAQVGSFAQPGSPLVTLVQTDQREIDVELDPRYAINAPTVSDLRFISQGREWPVKVLRVSSVIDVSARIVRARLAFVDEQAPIGSSGQLAWTESSGRLPVDLIVQRGGQLGVFIVTNDTAKFVVLPEAQAGRPADANLPQDTLVVSRGQGRLQDGDSIQVSLE
ncbi:MAG: efflux RND transporter periplasmic adaptor subunit [Woeseiaceae bacterium]